MDNKTNFRVRVMKYAWQIRKTTKLAWRTCMVKAWQLYKLLKTMRQKAVRFTYMKTDGSVRNAVGTINNSDTFGGKKSTSYKTLAYFDIEKRGFRCFRVENLLSVE